MAGLVYVNALHNPFVWDDFRVVANNRSLESLTQVRAIALHEASRPIVNFSYAVDRAIWGTGTFGFHLTSILLHVLNVVLLFLLARRLVADGQSGSSRPSVQIDPDSAAACAATLFAVHPIMTEAVGYISARADVLCTTFLLAACLSARRWIHGGPTRSLVITAASWLLALGTKEIAVVFPVLLLGCRSFAANASSSPASERLRRLTAALLAVTLVAAATRLAVLLIIENPRPITVHWPLVLVELDVVRLYLTLLIRPAAQSILHPVDAIPSLLSFSALLAVGVPMALILLAHRMRRVNGAIGLGIWWFLAALVPPAVLAVLDLGHPLAEHRAYLPCCGLFIAVGIGVAWAVGQPLHSTRLRILRPVAVGIAIVTLAGSTIVRNAVWADDTILWLDAVQKAPDIWLPHLMLGEAFHRRGDHERAIMAFRSAVHLRSDHADAHLKLGLCLLEMNRIEEARDEFTALRRLDPRSPAGPTGLGTLAMIAGRWREAEEQFSEALLLDPPSITARQSLALLNERTDRPAEALRWCREIEVLAPETPDNAECLRRNASRLVAPPPAR